MEDGKLMSVWMFPFVYVFMDTDNEMEDSLSSNTRFLRVYDFLFNYTMKENMIYEKLE